MTKALKDIIYVGLNALKKKILMHSSMNIIRSLSTAVKLGIVNDILVPEKQMQRSVEQPSDKTHPLRDIFGMKSLMCSSAGFHPGISPKDTNSYAPYALYPLTSQESQKRNRRAGSLEPIKTSLKTYQGIEKMGNSLTRLYEHAY